MPFQKGNKLGAKGRPVGSKGKTTDKNKEVLHELLYNAEDMIKIHKRIPLKLVSYKLLMFLGSFSWC